MSSGFDLGVQCPTIGGTRALHWVYWRLNSIKRRLPWWAFSRWARLYGRLGNPLTFRKYGRPDSGDVVLDVGAMIGEFTIPASLYADRVYALEPDPRSFARLRPSAPGNVTVLNVAASDNTGERVFNIASSPSSSSLDVVDVDAPAEPVGAVVVETSRLEDLPFMDEVTFLKIDAEGAEPEVLRGLGEYRPERISVDAGPERFGESTVKMVRSILFEYGYECGQPSENVVVGLCRER